MLAMNTNEQSSLNLDGLSFEALEYESGATAGDVDVFSNQVAIDPRDEVFEVEVDVFHGRVEFGGVVVAPPLRVEPLRDVALGSNEGAA